MNVNKIETLLCFAFQHSDGPFNIEYSFDGGKEFVSLNKETIKVLSDQEFVHFIKLDDRNNNERRWRDR
jgi:hypothetical protein